MKVVLILLFLVTVTCIDIRDDKYQLRLNEQNKFKIIQITDIHYGETEEGDQKTTIEMQQLITWEKPELAVLTGDMVSGYAWDGSKGWYQKQWDKWTTAFQVKDQKYMYIQGNHDSQADLNRTQVTQLDLTGSESLTKEGPSDIHGSSNYVKAVYDSTGEKRLFYLWAFDSMSDDCEGVSGWGCVYPDQVEWYREKSKQLLEQDNGIILPGYGFFHIPLPEYMNLWNFKYVYGQRNEDICCSSVNTGLFSSILMTGNIKATFCGHDHNNDFYGNYYGIDLFYGRKTGHGGYGPPAGMQRGARVLDFQYDPVSDKVTFNTWIRQEDGSIQQSQPLVPLENRKAQNMCGGMHADEQPLLKYFADKYATKSFLQRK